ncbi:MAG: hypothetical protein JWN34_1530 [Bryobacterales bacterium]|nr:hypothetical protein [Bryobacterales bacterium]
MDENNPVRRFLRAPLTAPLVWVLNIATSALYFRKSPHATLALTGFAVAILILLAMLIFATKQHDRRGLQRVTQFAALCFVVEVSALMMA